MQTASQMKEKHLPNGQGPKQTAQSNNQHIHTYITLHWGLT
jgi:hypothetical protein